MSDLSAWCCCCCPGFWMDAEEKEPLLEKARKGEDDDAVFLKFRKHILLNIDDVSLKTQEVRLKMKRLDIEETDRTIQNFSQLYNDHLDRWDDLVDDVVAFKTRSRAASFKEAVQQLRQRCDGLEGKTWEAQILSEFFVQLAVHQTTASTSSATTTTAITTTTTFATATSITTEEEAETLILISHLNQLATQLKDFIQRYPSLSTIIKSTSGPSSSPPHHFTSNLQLFPSPSSFTSSYKSLYTDPGSFLPKDQLSEPPSPHQQPMSLNQQQPLPSYQNQTATSPLSLRQMELMRYEEVMNSCEDDDIGEDDVEAALALREGRKSSDSINRISDSLQDYSSSEYKDLVFESSDEDKEIKSKPSKDFNEPNLTVNQQPNSLSLSESKSDMLSDQLDVRVCGFRNKMTLSVLETKGQGKCIQSLTVLKSNFDNLSRGLSVTDTLDLAARQLTHHIYDVLVSPDETAASGTGGSQVEIT